jgi:diaminohydroxyphosphoribosylaminopyrimidine deaminase/5-amino-6-(5-phosphoribosylamino)uracil reductase
VLDGSLSISPEARLLGEGGWSPVLIYARSEADVARRIALEQAGATVVPLAADAATGRIDPLEVARDLARRGVLGTVVEGGGHTLGLFLAAGLVDKWHWYVAPRVMGDPRSRAAVEAGAVSLEQAWAGRIAGVRVLGDDMLMTLYPDPTRTGA